LGQPRCREQVFEVLAFEGVLWQPSRVAHDLCPDDDDATLNYADQQQQQIGEPMDTNPENTDMGGSSTGWGCEQ